MTARYSIVANWLKLTLLQLNIKVAFKFSLSRMLQSPSWDVGYLLQYCGVLPVAGIPIPSPPPPTLLIAMLKVKRSMQSTVHTSLVILLEKTSLCGKNKTHQNRQGQPGDARHSYHTKRPRPKQSPKPSIKTCG